ELTDCCDIITTGGSVNARLKLEHLPLDGFPGKRVPSIHRCWSIRVPSMSTSTCTFTVHVAGSLSAYPVAFLRALASETIPFLTSMRLTPPPFGEGRASEELLRSWVPFAVARRVSLFAGILVGCLWITRRSVQPFSVSVLDQADNPRRLVSHDDESVVSSCAYPYATVLGGMPWWIQGDRLLCPLHSVDSQSQSWGVCITPASGGEELHRYGSQVIKAPSSLHPSSLAHVPFRGNGSQLRLASERPGASRSGSRGARSPGRPPGAPARRDDHQEQGGQRLSHRHPGISPPYSEVPRRSPQGR